MASGAAKAGIVGQVLDGPKDVSRWPVQATLLPNAVWLLDAAAAASWSGGPRAAAPHDAR